MRGTFQSSKLRRQCKRRCLGIGLLRRAERYAEAAKRLVRHFHDHGLHASLPQETLKRRHAFRYRQSSDAKALRTFLENRRRDGSHFTPEAPVDHRHRHPRLAHGKAKRVLTGRCGGIVGLSRISDEGIGGAEEKHHVRFVRLKGADQVAGRIDFGTQHRGEGALVELREAHVVQHHRGLNGTIEAAEAGATLG